jgi:hypothetical protein
VDFEASAYCFSRFHRIPATPVSLCYASRLLRSEILSEFIAQTYVKLQNSGAFNFNAKLVDIYRRFSRKNSLHTEPTSEFHNHYRAARILSFQPNIIFFSIMKCSIAIVTFISTVIPVALSLPANFFATSFELPTCGAVCCYLQYCSLT